MKESLTRKFSSSHVFCAGFGLVRRNNAVRLKTIDCLATLLCRCKNTARNKSEPLFCSKIVRVITFENFNDSNFLLDH